MKKTVLLIIILALIQCNTKEIFDGPNFYADGFEGYSILEDLIDGNNVQWSFFQNTKTRNFLKLDSTIFHTGSKSIKFFAGKSTEELASKASISKQKMAFWDGDIVEISFWYYIVGTAGSNWMFLFDFEEQAAIGAGPGTRLALVDNMLRIEHKFLNPDILQNQGPPILFPRDQWVNIHLEFKLSQKKKGYVKLWQDSLLIIQQDNWQTLPKDILYVTQGTKGMYSSIEFGITANSRDNETTVYVDDIDVKKIN